MVAAATQFNALDPNALADLKRLARSDANSPEALRAAAKQFEALFLQMVLKSMRDAVPSSGLMDSDETRMFQSLQDQQMTMNLAQGRGVGLAEVLYRQLGGTADGEPAPGAADPLGTAWPHAFPVPPRAAFSAARAAQGENSAAVGTIASLHERARSWAAEKQQEVTAALEARVPEGAREFVNRVWEHALAASDSTRVPAHFMVAQAALETGWGKAELRHPDGTPSYNLFNIKAGAGWNGPVVERSVTEYANGQTYTENARFRSYGSYAEAFRDYARLLSDNPRYAAVLGQRDAAGFARGLQNAGYATDPMYADKLTRIIGGNTLRAALSG
ncbi:MAG: flagellar assembly peptidoglycan hydrolase FlgJ [Rhodocyclales bacterium]|nr:flagellar assembly peptidoglycan hydrolase FlgJ [Rhodocyclales bacterium]